MIQDITKEPEIISPEEKLRLKLTNLVDKLMGADIGIVAMFRNRLHREIEKATPATLEKVRSALLELLK